MLQPHLRMNDTNHWLLIGGVLLISAAGVYLRVWQWPIQLLADDEWHALRKLLGADARDISTSFGRADHSIPITLYYYAVSQITPLTENIMRWPMLLAGLATPFTAVWLVRHKLNRTEQVLYFTLLALSPILIYYSRTARPYAISTLLAFSALVLFYYWANKPKLRYAVGYVLTCSLCAWMQPVTLALTLSPFLFFGCKSLYCWARSSDQSLFLRLTALGVAQLIVLCALLGPPIYYSLGDLTGKVGTDSPTLHSIAETFKLLTGSEHGLFTCIFLLIAAWGGWQFGRKHGQFALYLTVCATISLAVILSSGATWIQHPLVTARYSLPLLLVIGLFTAAGLNNLWETIGRFAPPSSIALILLCACILASGPLAHTYIKPINQFTGHMAYQFDYNWTSNVYNHQLNNRPVSPFYHSLASAPEKSLHLVIAPWFLEWHWNRWYIDQAVHQQQVSGGFVKGLCGRNLGREYSAHNSQVALRNMVHVAPLAEKAGPYDYFIYHKNAPRPELNFSPYFDCERTIRKHFGKPAYEDKELMVYKLKTDGQ